MKRTEDRLQIAAIRWFKMQYPDIMIHHSPNGGYRTKVEGGIFKAMGTIAGFPDIFIMKPNEKYHALFIEFKSEKGIQTKWQKHFEYKSERNGYKYVICRSLDEFMDVVRNYLNDKRQ